MTGRPQQIDGGIEQLPQQPDAPDHQAERDADQRGQEEAAIDARHRLPDVRQDGRAERIVVNAAEREVVHHDRDFARARNESRARHGNGAVPQQDQHDWKADAECDGAQLLDEPPATPGGGRRFRC